MRIVSLVPHATELLFALGLGDELVAVTHECDYPPQALELPPRHARRAAGAASARREIDAAVRERTLARRVDLRARPRRARARSSPT